MKLFTRWIIFLVYVLFFVNAQDDVIDSTTLIIDTTKPSKIDLPTTTRLKRSTVWTIFKCDNNDVCDYIEILAIVVVSCAVFFLVLIVIIIYLICTRISANEPKEESDDTDSLNNNNNSNTESISRSKRGSNVYETGLGFYSIELNDFNKRYNSNNQSNNVKVKQDWERHKERSKRYESDLDFIEKGYNIKQKADEIPVGQQNTRISKTKKKQELNSDDDNNKRQIQKTKLRSDNESDEYSYAVNNRPHNLPKNSVPVLPKITKSKRHNSTDDELSNTKIKYYSGSNVTPGTTNKAEKQYYNNNNTKIRENYEIKRKTKNERKYKSEYVDRTSD